MMSATTRPARRVRTACVGAVLSGLATVAAAVTPPALVSYEGILRDADGRPLDGKHEMVLRLFSDETGGDEILVDRHDRISGRPVDVHDGLFELQLGGGAVSDGSGPGTYLGLDDVFRDYREVYLRVTINGELLKPRTRIVAASYALNADHLDGFNQGYFLNNSTNPQTKSGPLTVTTSRTGAYGIEGYGPEGGGYFADSNGSGYAEVGRSNDGIKAYGTLMGGRFVDSDSSGYAWVGNGDYGIRGWGDYTGGRFADADSSGLALAGYGNRGIEAYGDAMAGYFEASDGSSWVRLAYLNEGVSASGDTAGGHFEDANDSGSVDVAGDGYGLSGGATTRGAAFHDTGGDAYAYVGDDMMGLEAYGTEMGGYFGSTAGTSRAELALSGCGIDAYGNTAGGYFVNVTDNSWAYFGYGGYGVYATGTGSGGLMKRDLENRATVGINNQGILAYGTTAGGYLVDDNSASWVYLRTATEKIQGSGSVSFVQNHPSDPDRVVVYAAPEGDEVATYTRGSARLIGGEARVPLGETFVWVTNPDLGLTVHVTPMGMGSDLYVASRSTEEIVVRSRDGSPDTTFDYIVFGLRIGFEEAAVVQPKTQEAYIPSMKDHRAVYAQRPELQRFSALNRFKRTAVEVQGLEGREPDESRATALKHAIQEYDPAVHGPIPERPAPSPRTAETLREDAVAPRLGPVEPDGGRGSAGGAPSDLSNVGGATRNGGEEPGSAVASSSPSPGGQHDRRARALRSSASALASYLPVSESVEPGDVLVVDPERDGSHRTALRAGDPTIVGVVTGDAGLLLGSSPPGDSTGEKDDGDSLLETTGSMADATARRHSEVPVAVSGIVLCKADAGYGSIRPGDLLATSPTPGHAMRADDPQPGTILGKALEPLETGTGLIKMLVMLR
jgi:hypothetical protein